MKLLNYLSTTLTVLAIAASANLCHAQNQSTKALTTKMSAGPTYPSQTAKLDLMISQVMMASNPNGQSSASAASQFDSGLDLQWPLIPMTKMHQVAEIFDVPKIQPMLFLNFDGQSSEGVAPYESTSGDRDEDIQIILFTAAQIFAPFDVKVQRVHGNSGQHTGWGATTIFIGDKSSNNTVLESSDSFLLNSARAHADADYPCPLRGMLHQPNSDTYNTGYVDPISANYKNTVQLSFQSWSPWEIAKVACHEAGHTFGLAHVLTEQSGSDMMSYDSNNDHFNHQDYKLTSLDAGASGSVAPNSDFTAVWWYAEFNGNGVEIAGVPLKTQNSYRTLMATLGERSVANDIANVASPYLVDGIYQDAGAHQLQVDYIWVSDIDRQGDYDVYDLTASKNQPVAIEVRRASGDLNPIVMVMNGYGTNIVTYDNDGAAGNGARANFVAKKGDRYKVVVGSLNGNTSGRYVLESMETEYKVNRRIKPATDLTIEMDHPSGK